MTETATREKPILFSGLMVRAILSGAKTQTRRVVKLPWEQYKPDLDYMTPHDLWHDPVLDGDGWHFMSSFEGVEHERVRCPYGASGDRLWVRETWSPWADEMTKQALQVTEPALYRADYMATCESPLELGGHERWKPSIHMPRWASRLTLEITDVRVERLQAISEADAIAEGMLSAEGDGGGPGAGFKWRGTGYEGSTKGLFHAPAKDGRCSCNVGGPTPAQCAFRDLWNSINSKTYPWESNPYVWCISFRRIDHAS